MNIISRKRASTRRTYTTHVDHGRASVFRAEKLGGVVEKITFRVHGEGERDYYISLPPTELESMHRELRRRMSE